MLQLTHVPKQINLIYCLSNKHAQKEIPRGAKQMSWLSSSLYAKVLLAGLENNLFIYFNGQKYKSCLFFAGMDKKDHFFPFEEEKQKRMN